MGFFQRVCKEVGEVKLKEMESIGGDCNTLASVQGELCTRVFY